VAAIEVEDDPGAVEEPAHVDAGGGGAGPRRVEELRREVQADDVRAHSGGPEGEGAGARGDVEDPLARADVHPREQVARRDLVEVSGDGGAIASGPDGAMRELELGDSRHVDRPLGGRG